MAKKHFENIIGKIIYGTLLFMPLLNVLGTSIYAIANKNAYESYYGETINEKTYTQINDITKLNANDRYKYHVSTYNEINRTDFGGNLNRINFNITKINQNNTNINLVETVSIGYYLNTTTLYTMYFYNSENTLQGTVGINANTDVLLDFEFTYVSQNLTNNSAIKQLDLVNQITYNKYSYLDNAFEYGIYKTENSPYYNWTTETAINDVIHQTTTTLGINNSFVDLLLTYWLLITIMYVIYDLGLMLIQIAHKKVHKICDKD